MLRCAIESAAKLRGRGGTIRRAAIIAVIVVAHVVLTVMLTRPSPPARRRAVDPVMTVHAVPEPSRARTVERDAPIDARVTAPDFDLAAPAGQSTAPCAIVDAVAAALSHDPAVAAALAPALAEPARAVMMWDGHWTAAGSPAIRRVVVATIAAQPAPCRDEIQIGPRLIFVSVPDATISIAVGSGTWRWFNLVSLDQYQK